MCIWNNALYFVLFALCFFIDKIFKKIYLKVSQAHWRLGHNYPDHHLANCRSSRTCNNTYGSVLSWIRQLDQATNWIIPTPGSTYILHQMLSTKFWGGSRILQRNTLIGWFLTSLIEQHLHMSFPVQRMRWFRLEFRIGQDLIEEECHNRSCQL